MTLAEHPNPVNRLPTVPTLALGTPSERDLVPGGRRTQWAEDAARHYKLKPLVFLVLHLMATHWSRDHYCMWWSIERMATELRMDRRTVTRAIGKLKNLGLIEDVRRRQSGSWIYYLSGWRFAWIFVPAFAAEETGEIVPVDKTESLARQDRESCQTRQRVLPDKTESLVEPSPLNPPTVTLTSEPEKEKKNSSSLLTFKQEKLIEKVLTEKERRFADVRTAWESIPGVDGALPPETLQELLRCDVEHVVTWLKAGSDHAQVAAVERTPGMLTSREYIAKYGLPKRLNKTDVESVPTSAPVQDT